MVYENLKYYVFCESNGTVENYNIFRHHTFVEGIKKIKKEKLTKEAFAEKVDNLLRYCFWARCEYEIVITSWPTFIEKNEAFRISDEFAKRDHYREVVNLDVGEKVDIYTQVKLNFDLFLNYLWENLYGNK